MAETLGELIVRLGLDANTFQSGLTNVSRQMKLSNAEFQAFGKAALASGDNLEVLRVKSNSLNTSMELQRQRIESLAQSSEKYATHIEGLKNKQDDLRAKVEAAKKAYDESANSKGKDSEETQALKEEYEKLKGSLSENEEMLRKAGVRLDETTIKTKQAEGKLADMGVELKSVNEKIAQLDSNLYQSGAKMQEWGDNAQKAGKELQEAGKTMESAGKTLSVAITAPIVAFGAGAIKAAMDFESAFTGVTKTIDMTAQETEAMRQAIIEMSETLPHSKEAISEVAQAAGQLGIEKENILQFTEVMLNMGVATDMTSTAAATAMARFANITQMPQENFERLGATIVELGNNFATTEGEITEMALRLAGAGDQIGLTEAEILGFSTALSSVGIQAEAGGSAFSKAMIQMQVASEAGSVAFDQLESHAESAGLSLADVSSAVRLGGKELTAVAGSMGLTSSELKKMYKEAEKVSDALGDFANVAGMSADEFAIKFREDAAGAIAAFIQGLGDVEGAGQSTILMLEDMGLTEVRLRDSLTRLAGNSELVGDAVNTASKAWEENIALTKEAEKFNATAANQIEVLKNRVNSIATEIGDDLTPKLLELGNKAVDTVTKKWSGMTKEQKEGTIHMASAAAATGPVILGLGKLTSGIGSTFTNAGKFISYLGETKKALSGVGDSTTLLAKLLPALTSPAGIATIAVAGLTTALLLATKDSREYQQSLKEARDTTEELAKLTGDASTHLLEAGKRIAEADQIILDGFADMSQSALDSLESLKIGAGHISAETVDSVLVEYESLGDRMKETIDTSTTEAISLYGEIFGQASGITQEEGEKILNAFRNHGEQQKNSIDDTFGTIEGIIKRSMQESGEITSTAMQEITLAIAKANADIASMMTGESGFSKTIEHQIKNGMIPTSKQGFEQLTEIAKTEREKQYMSAAEYYDKSMAYAEMLKQTDIEASNAAATAAEESYNRQIASADLAFGKMANIMYEANKAEVDSLVNRNRQIEENDKEISELYQARAAARLNLDLDYAAQISNQISELKSQNKELQLTPEEVEQLSIYKVLFDQNQLYQSDVQAQLDNLVLMLSDTAGLSETEARAIATGIITGFETLPSELTAKGQEGALALTEALRDNGHLSVLEADILKTKIIAELDGLKTETGAIGKETVDSIANGLAASQNMPVAEAESIVRATAEPFNELPALLEGKTAEAAQAIITQLENNNLITKEKATELGSMIDAGLVEGIFNGQQEVEKASAEVANAAIESAAGPDGIDAHSPSKKTTRLGESFDDGLILGMKNKQSEVETTAAETARLALEQIESYTQPFYQAGYNLGAGAADGLHSAGQSLIAEARSMARAAVEAMRDELDIHSPSRVARRIFQYVGEGAVLGLRDEQEILANAARALSLNTAKNLAGGEPAAPSPQQPAVQPRSGGDIKIEIKEIKIVSDNVKSPYEAERIGRNTADSIARNLRLKGVFMPR